MPLSPNTNSGIWENWQTCEFVRMLLLRPSTHCLRWWTKLVENSSAVPTVIRKHKWMSWDSEGSKSVGSLFFVWPERERQTAKFTVAWKWKRNRNRYRTVLTANKMWRIWQGTTKKGSSSWSEQHGPVRTGGIGEIDSEQRSKWSLNDGRVKVSRVHAPSVFPIRRWWWLMLP